MQIREALRDDLPEIMRLYRQLHPADPVLEIGRGVEVFDEILGSPGLTIFLVEHHDRVRGSCYLNIIPNLTRSARPYAIIENVITDVEFRGQGLGKALMLEVLGIAWRQGCYKAMLQTGSKKASTHAFYQACGFVADDKTGYVARP